MNLISEDIANNMLAPCAEPVRGRGWERCGKPSRFLVVNPADLGVQRVCGQHVGAAVKSASRGGDVVVRPDHPDEYAR
jgi:hypothetical protein